MKVEFLPGDLVYLRPWERGDAATILPWINNAAVTRTLLIHRPMNLQAEEKFIDEINASPNAVGLAVVERASHRVVGSVGLHDVEPSSRNAQFGIVIGDPADWGKGFGTEATRLIVRYAFETLNLHRVWLRVVASHTAAIRVYERVGFRREGVMREAHYREGCYADLVIMGLLRGEFLAG